MSIIVKPVDPSSDFLSRSVTFDNCTGNVEFNMGDILDIEGSLRRPGTWVQIEVGDSDIYDYGYYGMAPATITVKINAMVTKYPINLADTNFLKMPIYDLSAPITYTEPNVLSFTVDSGQSYVIDGIALNLPIRNLTVSNLSVGDFLRITVK
jgi:hypothetical protein